MKDEKEIKIYPAQHICKDPFLSFDSVDILKKKKKKQLTFDCLKMNNLLICL